MRPVKPSYVKSYKCGVLDNFPCTSSTWSFLIFNLILILGALISFITGASIGITINWVLDFSHSLLHSNRQKIYTQDLFHLVWTNNLTNYWLMPLELGNDPNQHWYFFEYNESKPVFLFCPWTIKVSTEQLKVVITRIDFTLKRQFRLRLQVYPEGEPLFSKFITLTRFHEHFASAIAAIQHYHDFPELGFPELDLTVMESILTDPVVNQYTYITSIVPSNKIVLQFEAPKTWKFDTTFGMITRRRVQTYSTKLPLAYHLPRHESNSHHNLFKMDLQLWILLTSNSLSAGNNKHF